MLNASDYQAPAEISRWKNLALGIGGICSIIVLGACLIPEARETALRAWLLGFMFSCALGIGGLGILMLQYLTGGAWGVVIRRVVEACSRTVPVLAVLFIPIAVGVPYLYEWFHLHEEGKDAVILHRGWYLTWGGFVTRAVIYFVLWYIMQRMLNGWSAKQDQSETYEESAKWLGTPTAFSGPTLAIFVLIVSFATIDWTMTLDPHWFSTIWGFLYVAGWALSCFSFAVVILAYLSDKAPMNRILGKRHFHDIGKLMLALVMVWAYFNFSQFLIIWSGNLPEETFWFLNRMKNGWGWIGLILILFHFAFPYLVLLSRDVKRNAKYLAIMAGFILVLRVVDVFYHIAPSPSATPGAHEVHFDAFWILYLLGPLGAGGVWLSFFFKELASRPLVPIKDPFLENAIEHGKGH